MRTFAAGLLVAVAVLAVGGQLALPAYYEHRVKDRLEEGGGTADVSVNAFPALTLIGGSGAEFEAEGRNLSFDFAERPERPFERLDGFERVDVDLRESEVGSVRLERFTLTRDGRDQQYDLVVDAAMTPGELARELGTTAAGPLGGLIGDLAADLLPGGGTTEVPVRVDASLDSSDGRIEVVDANGSVAGVPAGPLAEVVLGSVLDRL